MRISDWSSDVCSSDLRVVQVTVDAHGYAFARQSFGQWQALDEGPFEPVAWTEGTTPMLDGRQLQASFRFEPTGGSVQQRSEEHTSELQSLMRISYAVFCLKKKK